MNELFTGTAEQAIAESVFYDRCVWMAFDAQQADVLMVECDDHTTDGGVEDYWGTDEDGNEWRVNMEVDCVADRLQKRGNDK